MARPRVVHVCSECSAEFPQWSGRCLGCGEWNTLSERSATSAAGRISSLTVSGSGGVGPIVGTWSMPGESAAPQPLGQVDLSGARPTPTGLSELDRVLGGGLVPGSVTLLGGEPGVGKSTLLLQVLRSVASPSLSPGRTALLISAEESAHQVRLRAERLGPVPEDLLVLAGTDMGAAMDAIESVEPALVVVDSIQTVAHPQLPGTPGSLSQVRACAELLVGVAKRRRIPFVLVSHVTKDGHLAGPRALEHLVDTVLTVEGDRHHALRLVRAVKHRFGATGELGLFEMGELGMEAVLDPYLLLLGDRPVGVPGSVVLPAVEGQRALLVELQILTSPSVPGNPPRRAAQGLDSGRLAQLLAVLERRARVLPPQTDVFASVVGGIRVVEPAADLALALAVTSAVTDIPFPADLTAFGEIGLGGELRHVPQAAQRLAESSRVGFRRALVPSSCPDGPPGIDLLRVSTLDEACRLAFAERTPKSGN